MVLDIGHQWGADLDVSPTGDLAPVTAPSATTQRILRRLLTNAGDYIWSIGYGAGLPGFVGNVGSSAGITAAVRSQMFLEYSVVSTPPPEIIVSTPTGQGSGTFELSIRYVDAASRQEVSVSLPIAG
jgi:hypothetical protein